MPRWGKRLPSEEIASLEAQLRASLTPVEARGDFVEAIQERLQTPRPLYVPVSRTWQHSWLLFSVLSGTLILLTALTTLLFMRRGKAAS